MGQCGHSLKERKVFDKGIQLNIALISGYIPMTQIPNLSIIQIPSVQTTNICGTNPNNVFKSMCEEVPKGGLTKVLQKVQ